MRPGPIQGDMVHPYLSDGTSASEDGRPTLSKATRRRCSTRHSAYRYFRNRRCSIAMVGAGFTLARPTKLRRAMAAFKTRRDDRQFRREIHRRHARAAVTIRSSPSAASNRSRALANTAFPESHAACFALLVYASAGSSAIIPTSSRPRCSTASRWASMRRPRSCATREEHGVEVRPVDVNLSDWDCKLEDRTRAAGACTLRHAGMRERHPLHPCDAARLPADQRLFRGRWQDHRKRARRGLRFRSRSVAAHAAEACHARKARRSRRLSSRSGSTAAMRFGRCVLCSAPGTRTTCRYSRAWHAGARAGRRICRRCCRASMWSRTTGTCICR